MKRWFLCLLGLNMIRCQIRVQFECAAKMKFLAVFSQPMTSISDYQSVPWCHRFQNMYNAHMCKMHLKVEKWGFSKKIYLNEDWIMICEFFKIFELEHFWGSKLIAWADIRVLLIFYSFRSFRVDVERVIEKFTHKKQKFEIFKIHVTRLVCGKIAPQHYVSSHSERSWSPLSCSQP